MTQGLSIPHTEIDYEEWYHTERHATHFNNDYYEARAQIALTKFFKGIDSEASVLDYGCGLGQNILYLKNAFGYDISSFGVEFCRRKGIKASSNLEDYADHSFDYVFSSHVLEHHPHPKTMLEEMHRKLKPGGTLLLVIPHEKHGRASFEYDLNQHLYMWNFQNINNLLNMTGFKVNGNKYVRGAGYNRLLPLSKINFGMYKSATNLLSRLAGIKEMMVTATKPA